MISALVDWFASKLKAPRLWSKEEWIKLSSKEQAWVWWKHHWMIRGTGSAEVDQFTGPVKEIVLYGSIIILTVEKLFAMAGISIGASQLLVTVAMVCIVLWTINFILQWLIGNKIDNLDLIALNSEIATKRTIAFRELRKAAKEEEWRKAKH